MAMASLLLGGCMSGTTSTVHPSALRTSWDRLTGSGKTDSARLWDWVTAVPAGVTRADTVLPVVPFSTLVQLVPESRPAEIKVASAGDTQVCRISAIDGTAVNNCNQLHAAATRVVDSGKKVTVTVAAEGASQNPAMAAEVLPTKLIALSQAAAPQEQMLRVTADGNPWVLIREGGIRCKVMARVERTTGLMQVAVSLGVCWGDPVTLPVEIQADCDHVPLQCLTVSETLEALYGAPKKRRSTDGGSSEIVSFCKVSEKDDYLLPTNYRRLQQATDEAAKESTSPPPLPALASLPGVAYPGPAILGDARALSGFLLQRQIYQAGEPERIGWLIFSGEALRRGETVQISVNLGKAPHQLQFSLSKP